MWVKINDKYFIVGGGTVEELSVFNIRRIK